MFGTFLGIEVTNALVKVLAVIRKRIFLGGWPQRAAAARQSLRRRLVNAASRRCSLPNRVGSAIQVRIRLGVWGMMDPHDRFLSSGRVGGCLLGGVRHQSLFWRNGQAS